MKKKLLVAFLGMLFLSIGLNLIQLANYGMSPFDTTTLAIEQGFGINFGNAAMVIHTVCLILLIPFFIKKAITISEMAIAFITVFVITRMINFFDFIKDISVESAVIIFILFLIGFAMFCVAGALLMLTNIIITPSDKLNVTIAHYFKFHPGYVRLASDLIFLAISIFVVVVLKMDIVISLVTIFMGFGVGSIIRLVYNPLAKIFKMEA